MILLKECYDVWYKVVNAALMYLVWTFHMYHWCYPRINDVVLQNLEIIVLVFWTLKLKPKEATE